MKKTILALSTSLLLALPLVAQDRFRTFDNFDTARGVNVVRPDFVPIAAKQKPEPKQTTRQTARGNSVRNTASQKPLMSPSDIGMNRPAAPAPAAAAVRYDRLNMGTNVHLRGFTTGNAMVDSYIVESSRRHNIDPLLVYATMHQESAFKPRALSHKGASGLMQLMPATARRLGVTDIYDPKQNIEGGVKYLRILMNMFDQNVTLALAGYNAGEGAVIRYGRNVPPFSETREYVRRITARYTAISNGTLARNVQSVPQTTAAKLENKESRPLTTFEPPPVAIRLADGRMRLVNQ